MRRTFLAGLAMSAAATVAYAQQPASPRIAVIDVSRVYAESLLGKSYASEIDKLEAEIRSEQTKKQAELQKLDASLRTLRDEFQTRIKPHIEAVAKDHAVDIILDSQVAITINKDFDLSRDVIVKADEA